MLHFSFFLCLLLPVLSAVVSCTKESSGKVLSRPDCMRVDGVQSTSAVIHWRPQTSTTTRLNHIVLCTGAYHETPVNDSWEPAADFVTRYIPMEVHHLELANLKRNANYSCIVETERVGAGRPCHFTTINRPGGGVYEEYNTDYERLSRFRGKFNHMAATILLGGVLPMLLVGGCVGAIYLWMRYQTFLQKNKYMKQYQRVPTYGQSAGAVSGSPASPHSIPPSPYNTIRYPAQTVPRSPVPYNLPPSPYQTMPPSPYQTMPPSPYQTMPPSPYQTMPPSPYQTMPQSPTPLSPYKTMPLPPSPYTASLPPSPLTNIPLSTYQTIPGRLPSPQQPPSSSGGGSLYGVIASNTAPQTSHQPTAVRQSLPDFSHPENDKTEIEAVERDMSVEFKNIGIVFNPPPPMS